MCAGILAWVGVLSLAPASPLLAEPQPLEQVSGMVPKDWPTGIAAPVVVPTSAQPHEAERGMIDLRVAGSTGSIRIQPQYEPADPIGGTPPRAWFLWSANESDLGQRASIRFLPISANKQAPATPAYRSRHDDPMLHVTAPDGKPILSYWHGAPDFKNDKRYPLNDFIHPLTGMDGETLTACSPPDHIHHRGIFWSWVRNERNGKPIGDWWMPKNIHVEPGAIRFADGPVFSRFVARHFWIHQPEGTDTGERFVEEELVCRIFETTDGGRAIDIDLTLTALDDGVRIGGQLARDKGYSGLTVRFGSETDVKIACDQRVIAKASLNHLRARWVDWTGVFAGPTGQPLPHRSGAALFVHPTHPDLPPEWITRKYGPINVSYPGLDMLEIPRHKPLRLRYRLWVHRGDAKGGKVNEHYRAYAADWKWTKNSKR